MFWIKNNNRRLIHGPARSELRGRASRAGGCSRPCTRTRIRPVVPKSLPYFFHSSLLSSKIFRPFPIRLPCFLHASSLWPLTVYCRFSFIHFFPFRFLDLLFILTFVLSAAVCVLSHSFLTWISLYCSEWYADGIFFFIYAQDPFVCSVVRPLWFRGLCRCCWCLVEARLSIPNCTGPHVCLYYFVVPVLSYDFPFPSLAMTIFPFWR